jgi:hypothetical protein
MSKHKTWRWMAALLAAGALAGCESQFRISPDYGVALRQDVAAQTADPDAKYTGDPQPGANAERAQLAQQHYVTDKVVQPTSMGTGSVGGGSGGGGSSGGGVTGGQ